MAATAPRVVIIGAGFGGLYAAQTLTNQPVDVLLIDRQNFHTFTPLLYQVATCALEPGEIAYPVRGIFRHSRNVRFLLGEVTAIDYTSRRVTIQSGAKTHFEPYDYLLIAAGSVTNFFNIENLEKYAFSLKTLSDAVVVRNHILKLFERAAWTEDAAYRRALTTLVVAGGGPTGLETAGALHELYNYVLQAEYPRLKEVGAHVILIEALEHLLPTYPDRLRSAALKQLTSLGVEVILGDPLQEIHIDHIRLKSGRIIPTYTLVWSAGVKAAPVADMLHVPLEKAGRISITPTMEVTGRDHIYAVGDIALLENPTGRPYPMLIPTAKQQGILAARNILRRMAGQPQQPFRYHDRGIMATIGRSRAVAWIYNRIPLSGFPAWLAWLGLHLITLMGFRNRLNVFINWVWNYFTYERGVRILLEHTPHATDVYEADAEPQAEITEDTSQPANL